MNNGYYRWDMGWGYPFMGFIFFLVVFGIILFSKKDLDGQNNNQITALEILKSRYARGEIDEITFEKMKQNIQ